MSTGVSVDDPGVHCLLRLLKAQDLSFLQTSLPALSHNINGPLSSEQLQTLKTEISAYRNLSRNIPLTPEVYRHLAPAQANMSSNLPPSIASKQNGMNFPLDLLVQAKLEARLRELQMLPRDLPKDIRQKVDIELTKMRLLRKQQEMRNDIAHEIRCAVALHSTEESTCYQRQRVRVKSSEVNRFKQDQEKRRKKKHQSYLEAVINHSKAFKEFHSTAAQKMKRVNRALVNYHVSRARKEQQLKEKEEKDRMRALKENDEVAYLKLLEKTKNDRLTQLLHQTDDYLSQIGALVSKAKVKEDNDVEREEEQQKQREIDLNSMTEEEKKLFYEAEEEEAKQLESTKTYYTIAHTIKEEVRKQPDCLVGGTLKRYQLKGLQWLVSLYNNNLNGVLADEM
uniref:HSA domain-containing protein n=1 Tax=Vannella robusta TaxID=1487602 RepID=A0A7S4HP67_9EUKA